MKTLDELKAERPVCYSMAGPNLRDSWLRGVDKWVNTLLAEIEERDGWKDAVLSKDHKRAIKERDDYKAAASEVWVMLQNMIAAPTAWRENSHEVLEKHRALASPCEAGEGEGE